MTKNMYDVNISEVWVFLLKTHIYQPPGPFPALRGAGWRVERNGSSFLKSVYCLSGLGIVLVGSKLKAKTKERTDACRNISTGRKCLLQVNPIVLISISVLSLRSFNHEFTRFEKKELSMERFNKEKHPDL